MFRWSKQPSWSLPCVPAASVSMVRVAWGLLFIVRVRPRPPLGDFHQKGLNGICSLLKPLLAFMEGTSLFHADAMTVGPSLRNTTRRRSGWPSWSCPRSFTWARTWRPRCCWTSCSPWGGERGLCGAWWEGASFNSYIEIEAASSKVKHLVILWCLILGSTQTN